MKKLIKQAFLGLIVAQFATSQGFAQPAGYLKTEAPKTVTSQVTVISSLLPAGGPSAEGAVQFRRSTTPAQSVYYRTITVKPDRAGKQANVELVMNRITRKGKGFMDMEINVDTETALTNNEAEERELEQLQPLIKAKARANVPLEATLPSQATPDERLLFGLPPLHSVRLLSGIRLQRYRSGQAWTDTVQTTDGIYLNTYTPDGQDGAAVKLTLNGRLIPNNRALQAQDSPIPTAGGHVEATSRINKDTYTGELVCLPDGWIQRITLNRQTEDTISLFGTLRESASARTYTISNTIR